MGILDDAIRDHLDLKRRHGARDVELREIEEDAFGSGERPDPFAAGELFGATAASPPDTRADQIPGPATPPPSTPPDAGIGSEEPTRLVEPQASAPAAPPAQPPAPLEEPPPPPEEPTRLERPPSPPPQPASPPEAQPEEARLPEPEPAREPEPPLPEPPPVVPAPPESESLAELMADEEDGETAVEPSAEPAQQAESPLQAEPPLQPELPPEPQPEPEISGEPLEPRNSVPEPPPPPPEPGTEPPGRARGRVHHPTEEHPPPEPGSLDFPAVEPQQQPEVAEPEPGPDQGGGPELYDFETDEEDFARAPSPPSDEFDELGPPSDEAPYLEEEEPFAEEDTAMLEAAPGPPAGGRAEGELDSADPDEEDDEDEDLLASSPDFLEEEDSAEEDLWFEKGPPQDFDFEDDR